MPDLLKNSLWRVANAIGMRHLLSFSGEKLVLPFYHAVSDVPLPYIQPLYPHKTVREFEADLDFMLHYLQPVDLETVRAHASGEKLLTIPSFHLSFDDGLAEVATVVQPMLQRKGIPATVFVNSAFVDNKALFFRYKVALLLAETQQQKGQLPVFPFSENVKSMGEWQKWLWEARHNQDAQLNTLATLLNIDFDQFLTTRKPYLTLAQLKAWQASGNSIGAHSVDHPEYGLIEETAQLRQTTESIAWVKRHFSPAVPAFSFPFTDFGVKKSFFEILRNEKDAPKLFFGTGRLNKEHFSMHLQRLPMEEAVPATHAVPAALLVALLKKWTGSRYVRRK